MSSCPALLLAFTVYARFVIVPGILPRCVKPRPRTLHYTCLLYLFWLQVELRLAAALSGDPVLLSAFEAGEDVHALTARVILGKAAIAPEERGFGKAINFGILYGMGPQRLQDQTGYNRSKANELLHQFHKKYPTLFGYLTYCQQMAVAKGYVESIKGRRRRFTFKGGKLRALRGLTDVGSLPDAAGLRKLASSQEDAEMLRQATNAPLQVRV